MPAFVHITPKENHFVFQSNQTKSNQIKENKNNKENE
jgi:hypothetical protein